MQSLLIHGMFQKAPNKRELIWGNHLQLEVMFPLRGICFKTFVGPSFISDQLNHQLPSMRKMWAHW